MAETLREISATYAKKQPHQVDYLLEGAPLLEKLPFVPSTHGLQHVMEKVVEIDSAAFVQRDEPLPEADVTTELGHMDLGIMGFKVKAGEDKVAQLHGKGNFAAYLARRAPKIISKTGMMTDGLLARLAKQYALKNKNVIDAGGTGDKTSTIIAVRFVEDETCGVYDPNGFQSGALFDTTMLSGGNVYEDPSSGKNVYGAAFKNYTGFEFENPYTCAAIVNIDESHKPTAAMIKKILRAARAGDVGDTYIVTHPATADDYIDTIKIFNPVSGDSINTKVKYIDEIEVIRDYNLPETEEAVDVDGGIEMDTFGKTGEWQKELFKGQAISGETAVASDARNFGKGGMNASIAIKANADTTLASAGGTIVLQHSDKEDGTYSDLYTFTIPEAAKKGLLFEFILPSTFKGWLKASITGKEGATGTVTVMPSYIPR